MKNLILISVVVVLGYSSAGLAQDKASAVKKAVGDNCGGKTVASSDVPRLVKLLYVTCEPGSKVDVDGCATVPCLK